MSTMSEIRARHFDLGGIFHGAALRHPDLPIYLDHQLECRASTESVVTVREAVTLVDTITARLRELGVAPGSVVMVWHRDGFDLPLLASAVSRVGAVPAMLSPHLPAETVTELFVKLAASTVVSDAQGARTLRPLLPAGTQFLITDRTAGVVAVGVSTGRAAASPQPASRAPHKFASHDPILITHTSGTTRLPKLAIHSGRSLWYRVFPQQMISLLLSNSAPALISVTLVHTRFFGALGMFFWRGKPFIVARDTDRESIAGLLLTHRPDYLETHPNIFVDWEPLAVDARRPLACVKVLHAAFDAIHPRTMRVFLDASSSPRARFFRFYGQSEVGPSTGQYYTKRTVRSSAGQVVGRAVPGLLTVRIVDPDGRKLRPGQIGHIWIASRSRILGYRGDQEAYSRNVHGRWWDTGDMGSLDRLGRLRLADREIDQVVGVPSALHYEDMLMEGLPAVREAIVIDKDGTPVILVSLNEGHTLDADEITSATAEMPAITEVYVVNHDLFPLTATGKVQRPQLGRRLAEEATFARSTVARITL